LNTNPIQTTATAIGLTAGNYTVTITDANTVRSKTGNTNGTNWDYCIHIITNQCALFWNNGSATVSATEEQELNLIHGILYHYKQRQQQRINRYL
jgi:hypothetical protein